MKMRVHPRDVELVIHHEPGCLCDNTSAPDGQWTVVQLGCVTSYLVSRVTLGDEETEREMTDRLMQSDEREEPMTRVACGAVGPGGSYCEREPHNPAELHGHSSAGELVRW